jgi:hypothetical protein
MTRNHASELAGRINLGGAVSASGPRTATSAATLFKLMTMLVITIVNYASRSVAASLLHAER